MPANTRRRAAHLRAGGEQRALRERMAELERLLVAQNERIANQEERLITQRTELEGRLAVQQAEIERLRAERGEVTRVASPARPALSHGRHAGPVEAMPGRAAGRRASRRGLLRLGGAAAAAGVVAAATGAMEPRAAHAAPDPTGSGLILGVANDAGATTILQNTSGLDPSVLFHLDGTVGAGPNFPQTAISAIVTGDSSYALAVSSDSGVGAYANSDSGIAMWLAGTGRLLQAVQPFVGAPATGSHFAGEQIRDANGDLWICVFSGTPGSWRKVAAPQFKYAGGALNLLPVPIRLLDTRAGAPVGFALPGAPIGYHATLQMQAANLTYQTQTIPAGASAVFGNLVVALAPGVNCGDGSSLICWPNGQPRPAAVNVVFNPGDLRGEYTSTFTLVAIGASNLVNIYNQPITPGVAVDVIFDAFGFVM